MCILHSFHSEFEKNFTRNGLLSVDAVPEHQQQLERYFLGSREK
ncbi:hypothetical protein BRCON_2426 [Candidatus Sumerlaea chitinivorans]|uniref:Uncharacterized protein n=1 Tax=Sumerlaea chitinivorans TaxID=2250252 RepID=A0A2Z4Y856_SUMC1|nr:hypothetical protein BRCON_2426 [Candidatus Sumerlaea chitinivorans]